MATFTKGQERSKFTMCRTRYPQDTSANFLFTTGNGELGQLGLGVHYLTAKHPMWVKLDHDILSIHAGGFHSLCLTDKGQVLSFGNNDQGSLGRVPDVENSTFVPAPVALPSKAQQITAGEYHSVALLENGCVYAWGNFKDSYGMTGLTLDGCQPIPVLVFSNQTAVKIASGANHFIVLSKEGEIFSMGVAEHGQLGRIPQRSANRYCRKAFDKQLALFPIFKPNRKVLFDNIWAGGNATFAKVAGSNEIYAFGSNSYKQLGCPAEGDMVFSPTISPEFSARPWKDIKCDERHTLALDTENKVHIIGRQDNALLGLGPNVSEVHSLTQVFALGGHQITEIGVGSDTSFAAPHDNGLVAWGTGSSGQLGTGDHFDRKFPFPVTSRALDNKKITQISGGVRHTMILGHYAEEVMYL